MARKPAKRKAKPKSGGSKASVINKYAKSSGISKSTLSKVYSRGLGAFYSSGSRPELVPINGRQVELEALLQAKVELEKQTQI